MKKILIGLLATSETKADFICGANDSKCSVTCKNGGLHWSVSKADFHQYDHGFFRGKCDPTKSRDGTHYEMTIPFGSCGLKRKVWWSNNTIHYMYTQSFYSGRQFDTLQVTCSHEFNKNWTYALSSGLADRTAWTTTAPPITTTTTTVQTTTTTSKLQKALKAINTQFATETIQAVFPSINLKMVASSNDENVEETDEMKHYLEVINDGHSTTWGGRLRFKVSQNQIIPGIEFKITDCSVYADGSDYSFPVLSNEVGNHIVDFKFETENSNPASIEMSFKSFQFREGNGQQRITCKIMTCQNKCEQGEIESADSVIATLVADANKILSVGNHSSMKNNFEQKLARVGNNLVTVRKKVSKRCEQRIGFNDSRSISRMGGEFNPSNQCEEMRLIQAELMSWAQVFCEDCRMEHQTRLGRLHHQISRTFETLYKKLCNSN